MKTINHNGELYCKLTDLLEEIGHMCAAAVEEPQEEPQKGPFDRVDEDDYYYYIDYAGRLVETREMCCVMDAGSYDCANYCTDPELMEQRALHETLNRLLWRYSEQHGGDRAWDGVNQHWCIFNSGGRIAVQAMAYANTFGCVHFAEREIAEAAIKEIVEPFMAAHPEFVW